MSHKAVPPHLRCFNCRKPSGGYVLCSACAEAIEPFRLQRDEPARLASEGRRRKQAPTNRE